MGNLFPTPWFQPNSVLNLRMLQFYIDMGWDVKRHTSRLFCECSSRGDIAGLQFLIDRDLGIPDQQEYCALAGAAGHLEALVWLRSQGCPWDPLEVYQEARNNCQIPVLEYFERKFSCCFDPQRCNQYAWP
jgi:hypothetical protein